MFVSNLWIFALLLINVHAATKFSKRQYAVVFADAKQLDLDIRNATQTVGAFDGTSQKAQNYVKVTKVLDNDLQKANNDCASTSTAIFTTAQSQQLVNYLNGVFLTDLRNLITTYDNKKPVFDKVGFTPIVKSDICRFRKNTNTWLTCLVNKSPTAQQPPTQSVKQHIIDQFDQAVRFYGASC